MALGPNRPMSLQGQFQLLADNANGMARSSPYDEQLLRSARQMTLNPSSQAPQARELLRQLAGFNSNYAPANPAARAMAQRLTKFQANPQSYMSAMEGLQGLARDPLSATSAGSNTVRALGPGAIPQPVSSAIPLGPIGSTGTGAGPGGHFAARELAALSNQAQSLPNQLRSVPGGLGAGAGAGAAGAGSLAGQLGAAGGAGMGGVPPTAFAGGAGAMGGGFNPMARLGAQAAAGAAGSAAGTAGAGAAPGLASRMGLPFLSGIGAGGLKATALRAAGPIGLGLTGATILNNVMPANDTRRVLSGAMIGAGGGAAAGAALGSIIPGPGTLIGAAVGAGAGALFPVVKDMFGDTGPSTPEEATVLKEIVASSGLDDDTANYINSMYSLLYAGAKTKEEKQMAYQQVSQLLQQEMQADLAMKQQDASSLAAQALAYEYMKPAQQNVVNSANQQQQLVSQLVPGLPKEYQGLAQLQAQENIDSANRLALMFGQQQVSGAGLQALERQQKLAAQAPPAASNDLLAQLTAAQ